MKTLFIRIIERVHLLFFGCPMSGQMKLFLSDLSWSFYSSMVALPTSMIVVTLAGRFMGPTMFGQYNLIVIFSSYIIVVAFCGLDISAVKEIVKSKDEQQKRESFFSAFVFVMAALVLLSGLANVFRSVILTRLNLSSSLMWFTIAYTLVISVRALFDILIRGLEKFKFQAVGKIIEMLTLGGSFLFLAFYLKHVSYQSYVVILIGSMAAACLYYFFFLKDYFSGFSFSVLKRQLAEGRFFMLSALLATIFISLDRLIIAKYVDITTLGVYSAYYLASLGVVTALSAVFVNVFLPATAKMSDKSFTKKLDHFFVKGFLPLFIMICLLIMIFLSIFGKAYPFSWDYVLMFSLAATLTFFQNLQNTVLLDAAIKRYIYYAYIKNFINLVTGLYYLLLVRYVISIDLILVGYAASVLITMAVQRVLIIEMREPSAVMEEA